MITPIIGMPGVGSTRTATPLEILAGNIQLAQYVPGAHIISGSASADVGNSPDTDVLRSGNVMGRIGASGKYANSILGVSTAAITTNSTTLAVAATVGAEMARRIGATGSIKLTGPATANGSVNTQTLTYSAISGTSVTIAAPGTNGFAAVGGSFVQPADGSETPLALLAEKWGTKVSDQSGVRTDVLADALLLAGHVKTANVVNYPSDTGLLSWLKTSLRAKCPALTFDDDF